MKSIEYYLEIQPQPWSGRRQLHADECRLMPAKDQLKPIGKFAQAAKAMTEARAISSSHPRLLPLLQGVGRYACVSRRVKTGAACVERAAL